MCICLCDCRKRIKPHACSCMFSSDAVNTLNNWQFEVFHRVCQTRTYRGRGHPSKYSFRNTHLPFDGTNDAKWTRLRLYVHLCSKKNIIFIFFLPIRCDYQNRFGPRTCFRRSAGLFMRLLNCPSLEWTRRVWNMWSSSEFLSVVASIMKLNAKIKRSMLICCVREFCHTDTHTSLMNKLLFVGGESSRYPRGLNSSTGTCTRTRLVP